VGLEGLEPPTS